MANRIRGITVEIGGDTTKLDKALKGTNKQLSSTQSSLRDVERLLKLDPGNVTLLEQRQRLLSSAVETTSEKLRTLQQAAEGADAALARGQAYEEKYAPLKESLDDVRGKLEKLKSKQDQMDESFATGTLSDEKYQAFNQTLADTQAEYDKLIQAQKNLQKEFEGTKLNQEQYDALQRELVETQLNLEDLEKQAKQSSDGLDNVGDSASEMEESFSLADGIVANFAGGALTKLLDMSIQAAEAIWNLDEATKEYRESAALLSTAFETAGFSADVARQSYVGFYSILGDTGQATEASMLLSQLATNEKDVAKWIEIAAGIYGTFGESIPIESLIEATNETAKVGKVTGTLADALNWVGLSEDEVNTQLSSLNDETARAQLLMNLLALEYSNASETFYENNKAIIESRQAQSDMDESLSVLGQSVADLKTHLLETFGPVTKDLIIEIANVLEDLSPIIDIIATAIVGVVDIVVTLISLLADAVGWLLDLLGLSGSSNEIKVSTSTKSIADDADSSTYNIPGFATGGVFAPNNPMLGILGDNRTEYEVAAPESMLRETFLDALAQSGLSGGTGQTGGGPYTFNFIIDGQRFARLFVPYLKAENNRLGVDILNR